MSVREGITYFAIISPAADVLRLGRPDDMGDDLSGVRREHLVNEEVAQADHRLQMYPFSIRQIMPHTVIPHC